MKRAVATIAAASRAAHDGSRELLGAHLNRAPQAIQTPERISQPGLAAEQIALVREDFVLHATHDGVGVL